MSYKIALDKAWQGLNQSGKLEINFLADIYEIDFDSKKVFSLSCNTPAPEYIAILILHYIAKESKGLPGLREEWISFKELPGGQAYFDAFKKRDLNPVVRKYGRRPKKLTKCLERLPGREEKHGDASIVLEVFENVPILITVSGEDDEFPAEANMLFDKSIQEIFCTEDIAVLGDIIARAI